MKIFVTGVNGQAGFDAALELRARGHEVTVSGRAPGYAGEVRSPEILGLPYRMLDITDREAVRAVLREEKPDALVHCAAWTAVDAAEDPENREAVFRVNRDGTRNLAEAGRDLGCRMLYLSTDYVFDGRGETPWQPDCRDFAPLNVYGASKLAGEAAVEDCLERYYILRIAWVFGRNGKNFVRTMLNLAKNHDTVRVVCDQIGTPTYTPDLARLMADLLESEEYGIYHATNEGGFISWYDFAREIYRQAGCTTAVLPVTTAEYGLSRAARPFNSRLDKSKLVHHGFRLLPDWQDALGRYLEELKQSNHG